MLIDEIKKANMQAMKERDTNKRAILSVVITKYNNLAIELKAKGQEPTDKDLLSVIQKTSKELQEEMLNWEQVGDEVKERETLYQFNIIQEYLPKQLTEEEIKDILTLLEGQNLPSIMKYFKENYAGQVDMSLVSKIARGQ